MKPFHTAIETATRQNTFFRQVLFTADNLQLVLMSLKPNEDIGMEVHDVDQFFRFEQGEGEVIIDNETFPVADGDVVVVPAGSEHNIRNVSATQRLQLYTIYAPPHHPDGTIHQTKAEAMAEEEA